MQRDSGQHRDYLLSGNSLRRELSLAHLPREASSQLAGILPRHGGQPSQLLLRTSAGQWHSWSSDDRSSLAYVHTDHLGVPRLVTGSDQGILWQGEMQPFGELNLKQDKLAMPLQLRYPGQYHDDETGLYYNGQRYYDPKLGRYTTPDPIGLAGGVNTYAYVEGDPVNKADPSGLMSSVDMACLRDPQFCSEILGQMVQNNGNIIAKITGDTCLAAKADADAEKIRSGGNWLTATMFLGVAKNAVVDFNFLNKAGKFYPNIVDLRTGRSISFPIGNLQRVPKADRVSWGTEERGAFIKEWYDRGYKTPRGGWSEYDIHHIQPREFGGSNGFWNLVPVQRQTHQQEFNSFWRDM